MNKKEIKNATNGIRVAVGMAMAVGSGDPATIAKTHAGAARTAAAQQREAEQTRRLRSSKPGQTRSGK